MPVFHVRRGAVRPPLVAARVRLGGMLWLMFARHHAPKSLRRSAAALPKIRMPKTTMIAVDS